MKSIPAHHDLEDVATAFKQWRDQCQGRQRIPAELRAMVVSLVANYSKNKISKALSINHTMINRWAKEVVSEGGSFDHTGFLSLPVEQTTEPVSKSRDISPPLLTMAHINGWTLHWHTLPDAHQLKVVLTSIQGDNP